MGKLQGLEGWQLVFRLLLEARHHCRSWSSEEVWPACSQHMGLLASDLKEKKPTHNFSTSSPLLPVSALFLNKERNQPGVCSLLLTALRLLPFPLTWRSSQCSSLVARRCCSHSNKAPCPSSLTPHYPRLSAILVNCKVLFFVTLFMLILSFLCDVSIYFLKGILCCMIPLT